MELKLAFKKQYAVSRTDLMQGHTTVGKSLREYIKSFALLFVAEDLRAHGLSAGDILVYMEMVWIAGKDLDHEVPAVRVGEKLQRSRQAVRKSIAKLVKKGVIKEERMNQYLFTRLVHLPRLRQQAQKTKDEA